MITWQLGGLRLLLLHSQVYDNHCWKATLRTIHYLSELYHCFSSVVYDKCFRFSPKYTKPTNKKGFGLLPFLSGKFRLKSFPNLSSLSDWYFKKRKGIFFINIQLTRIYLFMGKCFYPGADPSVTQSSSFFDQIGGVPLPDLKYKPF